MTGEEIKALVASMSLEEKVGQMVQLNAGFLGDKDTLITGPAGSCAIEKKEAALCGSILGTIGAKEVKELGERIQKEHPHQIPMLFMYDIINGHQTIFPIPLAQGCSFDPELAKTGCEIAAKESAVSGLHVTFAPMLDLVRDARWGRVMESPGEDPYLNACFAKAMVEGYQGEDGTIAKEGRLAACLKHFAGYGYPEGGREYDNAELSERTFLQDYLTGYKGAVDAGCRMAMTSFQTLNRVPSTANKWLMRDILRGELGFDGVLISDYAAVEELIPHGIAEDKKEAARLAIEAGVDIDMMSDVYLHYLPELVREGSVPESLVDEAVLRILTLKNDLGLFENPYKDGNEERAAQVVLCKEHRDIARQAAAKTFVLLKNEEEILPLKKEQADTILFAGPYVENRMLCGSWSFPKTYDTIPTIKERVSEKAEGKEPVFLEGCSLFDAGFILKRQDMGGMSKEELAVSIAKTVEAAKKAKTVVLCLGEHFLQTGEAGSRTDLTLPACQMELLSQVAAVNPNVVVVLFSGRPLVVKEIEQYAKAVMMVWLPGTEGAGAIADVLFGDQEPSGRLSMSIPYCVGQEPIYYNRFQTGRPTKRGELNPFQTGYIDVDYRPHYSFGEGMGYTAFSYSEVVLDQASMAKDEKIEATVVLTNTGKRTGTEVVQLYIRDVSASVVRPLRELKGFERVTLEPGESKKITFSITEEMLRFVRMDWQRASEAGLFEVYIGADSTTENKAQFRLV